MSILTLTLQEAERLRAEKKKQMFLGFFQPKATTTPKAASATEEKEQSRFQPFFVDKVSQSMSTMSINFDLNDI